MSRYPNFFVTTINTKIFDMGVYSALQVHHRCHLDMLPIEDAFEVSENDTVWDAWLTTVNLLDIIERSQLGTGTPYDLSEMRNKVAKICRVAELHWIDKDNTKCNCGLSQPEHLLLKRKILKFYKMQVHSLKLFLC